MPISPPPAYKVVSFKEALALLGICRRTLRYWEAKGEMPNREKRGHRYYHKLTDILTLRDALAAKKKPGQSLVQF